MNLPGLTEQQTSDLKFSVNPLTGVPRPLSPIEVMKLIQILVDQKMSKKDISEALDTELSNINNFCKLIVLSLNKLYLLIMLSREKFDIV